MLTIENNILGHCTCEKCGKEANVVIQGYCQTTMPPRYFNYYHCPECGYNGVCRREDVKYDWDNKDFDLPKTEEKIITEEDKDRKLWLIAMNIDSLRNVVNGYLDDIKYLYSIIPAVIEDCKNCNIEYKDSKHLKGINKLLEKDKNAIIGVLSNNLKTNWGDAIEKVGTITVREGLTCGEGAVSITTVPTHATITRLKENND